jgi:branched-subunit amino acid aminotransferase/4-amino-4-deoxychorismate lyase
MGRRLGMQLEGVPVNAGEIKSLALYNYGHFTSMLVEGMRVRGLSMHLDRLNHDSAILFGKDVGSDRVRDLVRKALNGRSDPVTARVTVFAPDFDMSKPSTPCDTKVLVSTRNSTPAITYSPLRVKSAVYHRDLPQVKHVGLFGQLQLRRLAQLEGYDDTLFVDREGVISEGATWNIAFVKSGRVIWPESEILHGITMRIIKGLLSARGIESVDKPITLSDVTAVDSAFATNAAMGVRPISQIDSTALDVDAQMLTMMRQAYWATQGEAL